MSSKQLLYTPTGSDTKNIPCSLTTTVHQFPESIFGHDAIFPSSAYCVAFLHSPYCFLWLIFLLAFPAALVWVSRLPVGFQNNSSCQPSFLPASPLILPRLLFITPQPILQYLSVSFLHPFLPLHYLTRSCPLHLTLFLSNLLTWILFTLLLYFPPLPYISLLTIHLLVLCPSSFLSPSLPHLLSVRLSSSSSFVWQWSGSTLADSAVCVNWVLSFTAPSPPIPPPITTTTAAFPPHIPPSLLPFLLPPTFIPLQARELTFQPQAAGLNDCLWGRLWLHNPAANIWATHIRSHLLHTCTNAQTTHVFGKLAKIHLNNFASINHHNTFEMKQLWCG